MYHRVFDKTPFNVFSHFYLISRLLSVLSISLCNLSSNIKPPQLQPLARLLRRRPPSVINKCVPVNTDYLNILPRNVDLGYRQEQNNRLNCATGHITIVPDPILGLYSTLKQQHRALLGALPTNCGGRWLKIRKSIMYALSRLQVYLLYIAIFKSSVFIFYCLIRFIIYLAV